MKKFIMLAAAAALAAFMSSCTVEINGQLEPTTRRGQGSGGTDETTTAMEEPPIGEGVKINYIVTSDEAEIEITACPSYGDKRMPYVSGTLTKGDPFAYEVITIIMVGGHYYGKKPFNNSPNVPIKGDGTFRVQYSSNDGQGTDWNAEYIYLFLVPSGYEDRIEPDVRAGYVVPPRQVADLIEDSVCVVQISREIVTG